MSSEGKNFMKGAAILSVAGVIVKILGAIYRIPIGNMIKTEGMGYYQTAYPFYTLLLTVSTTGFPIAVAKLVSERRAKNDEAGAHRVFKVSLVLLSIIGILTSLIVFFFAENIVDYLGNPNAYYSLLALTPALLFVPVMSAFRGYFQGTQNMVPTALSQIAEQFFRVASGLFLAYILLDVGIPEAAGGASLGGSIGALMGTLVMAIIYLKNREEIINRTRTSLVVEEYKVNQIIKDIVIIAVPITIGGSIAPIMDAIDTKLVLSRLQTIGYSELQANELFGQLKGFAQTLINLPQVFSISIGMSLVPAISEAVTKKQQERLNRTISSGIRITLLIGLPAAFGLFVLATPIIRLLYFNNTPETIASTGEILRYLSLGVIFLTLVQILTSTIQGLGKPMIPVINLFIGAVVKVVLTYVLTGIPSINVKGAAISTVVAYAIASTLNLIVLIKHFKVELRIRDILIRPLISALGMAVMVQLSYSLTSRIIGGNLSTLISILVGIVVYVILLFTTGSITNDDLRLLPKGEKIIELLDREEVGTDE